jgi:hypothetical protein
MLAAIALLLVPQRLDPHPEVAYPDQEVVVHAIDRAGAPLAGLLVGVKKPSGASLTCTADQAGAASFVPGEVGLFELSATPAGGPQVFAVYKVVARPRRWLYALALTPLGLGLLFVNLRRLATAPSRRARGSR